MFKTSQPTIKLFALITTIAAGFFITSCNNPAAPPPPPPGGKGGDTVMIPNAPDTSALSKIDHAIPRTEITQFRKSFYAERQAINRNNPDLFITESEGFNKTQVLELLKDPRCVGLRIYYGVLAKDKKKELRMILVGTDSQGKDLFITRSGKATTRLTADEVGLEYGQCCVGSALE